MLCIFRAKMKGSLYLIPNKLGESSTESVLPPIVSHVVRGLDHFIVENVRSARRFVISLGYEKPIDDIHFYEMGKHIPVKEMLNYLHPCLAGKDMGVVSEAGVPGVADPGSLVISVAHEKGIRVIPLTGPSSILLALMASGLNGQNFAFNGYIPVNTHERSKRIIKLETFATRFKQSQIFIETPFRNNKLLDEILKSCNEQTLLCIACDITLPTEFIQTRRIKEWKKERVDLHKRPCIFIIGSH